MPTTSPSSESNETSRSAQMDSVSFMPLKGRLIISTSRSRSIWWCWVCPSRYRLERPWISRLRVTAVIYLSHEVGHGLLRATAVSHICDEMCCGDGHGYPQSVPVNSTVWDHHIAEHLYQRAQRVKG